jgi:hypothetical protein
MLGATKSYLAEEALPRMRGILLGSEVFVSIGIGVFAALWGEKFFPAGMKIGELCGTFLSYTAIAMGFCLAGLTIALTLPDREFAKKLATTKAKENGADAYSDLLFVFSWTAIAHWISLVVLIVVFMHYGSQKDLFPEVITQNRRIMIGVLITMNGYAFCQFLVTLITLSQVGRRYIETLTK